jgi:hypothetical protein
MKSNLNDKVVDEFLNSQTKQGTFKSYKTVMKQYLEFTGKTGQELLDIKRNDKDFAVENSMLAYRKYILSKGKSENYAVGCVMTVRGFYSYYRLPLMFRRQESKKLGEKNRTTQDYLFDKEDLAKMALAGNLKERYILLVGKSVGLRASDFICLTYGTFRSVKLENEAPLSLGQINTKKESVKAYPFLDSDAIPIVKQILESNKDKKDNERVLTDTEDNLSVILQTLAKKAGMEIDDHGTIHGKRVRFHCLRKFLIDRLSAYAGESQWKQIVGKAIDEGAYVSQDQLRGVYARAMKDILINGNGMKVKKLIELENALLDSQKRLTNVETTNEVLRKELGKVANKNEELEGKVSSQQKQIDDINVYLQKQEQIRIKKQQTENENLYSKQNVEIRQKENLDEEEKQAPDRLGEYLRKQKEDTQNKEREASGTSH